MWRVRGIVPELAEGSRLKCVYTEEYGHPEYTRCGLDLKPPFYTVLYCKVRLPLRSALLDPRHDGGIWEEDRAAGMAARELSVAAEVVVEGFSIAFASDTV